MRIDKVSKIPLYYQLYELIAREIDSNIYNENDKLPSERELCEKFEISRSTVRQAMSELEKDGYIYKEQGKGIFVSVKSIEKDLLNFYSFTDDMKELGKIPSSRVLDFEKIEASEKIVEKLALDSNEEIYKFTRLRLADGEPMILETTYLPAKRFPNLSMEELENTPMYDIFREKYELNFTNAKERFKPVLIRDHESETLEVSKEIPGMMIERSTYENEEIIEYTISIARGDKFEYVITLEK